MKYKNERALRKELQKKERIHKMKLLKKFYKALREVADIPLEQPFRYGYKKFFTLKENCVPQKDIAFWLGILKIINRTIYSKDGSFEEIQYRWGRKRRACKRAPRRKIRLYPRALSHNEWSALNERQRRCFIHGKDECGNTAYTFIQQAYLEESIGVHWVTHVRMVDPDLQSEIAQLERFFERDGNRTKFANSRGIYRYSSNSKRWNAYIKSILLVEGKCNDMVIK